MSRHRSSVWPLVLSVTVAAAGCQPVQPFYFAEDGDLSHYLDMATEIEEPYLEEDPLEEVIDSHAPLTVGNAEDFQVWDVSLEEAIRITLENSTVMRELGVRVASGVADNLSREILNTVVKTVYDPAIVESGAGGVIGSRLSGTGVEAALSDFDARLTTNMFWERNDRPQNFRPDPTIGQFFIPNFQQDLGRFSADITKTAVSGGTFSFRNNTIYDANNNPARALYSDWSTNLEAEISQPLLQGFGTQYNRIAGPQSFNAYAAGFNSIDGVMIARVRVDQTLADFEAGVRDLLQSVESAYWDLYFAYRNLDARKVGRDSALETWKRVYALSTVGSEGGEAEKEAQARSQYFFFRAEVETALAQVFRAENRLRFGMGLAVADGRLIRPIDEPTTAWVQFDWTEVNGEALYRRVEIRKQKWTVKQRQLELIAARNHLLPRLDAVARYRWQGLGDDFIQTNRNGLRPIASGSNAVESLTGGDFQDWMMGLQFSMPIGFRRQLSQVRNQQLLLARSRAMLRDLQLEISHQLAGALRDLDQNYHTSISNMNRLVASQKEVDAVEAAYDAGTVTLDLLLDAQRRRADAETAYYQSLVDYNRAIAGVHDRKGSLLDYDGVFLAEGPWPAKAYFDAMREARKRDASMYLDYGFTRPRVLSRGQYQQRLGAAPYAAGEPVPTEAALEELPLPQEAAPDNPGDIETLPEPTAARQPRSAAQPVGPVGPRREARRGHAGADTEPAAAAPASSPPTPIARHTRKPTVRRSRTDRDKPESSVTNQSGRAVSPPTPREWQTAERRDSKQRLRR